MPDGAVITFAPFELEGDHFFIFALLDHFSLTEPDADPRFVQALPPAIRPP
jgi:hypothetical protein